MGFLLRDAHYYSSNAAFAKLSAFWFHFLFTCQNCTITPLSSNYLASLILLGQLPIYHSRALCIRISILLPLQNPLRHPVHQILRISLNSHMGRGIVKFSIFFMNFIRLSSFSNCPSYFQPSIPALQQLDSSSHQAKVLRHSIWKLDYVYTKSRSWDDTSTVVWATCSVDGDNEQFGVGGVTPTMFARRVKRTGGVDDVLVILIRSLDEIEIDVWFPKLLR
jgi:hypothetical protein